MKTLYEILGVKTDATPAQMKAAYRSKAKAAHPDTGGSQEAFNELNLAYEVLKNPDRRARYDSTGQTDDVGRQQKMAAEQRIHNLVHSFLLRDDVIYVDMIAWIKNQILVELESLDDAQEEAKKYLAKLDDMAGRVGGNADVILAFVTERRQQVNIAIDKQHQERLMREQALKMLDDATFKFENRPARDPVTRMWVSPSGNRLWEWPS